MQTGLLALARVQPPAKAQEEEEKQAGEYARGQSQRRRFFQCKFYSVSFLSPFHLRSSFHFLFKLLLLPPIPRDRLYASSVNSSYRGSFMWFVKPSFTRIVKNRRERERERINEFWQVAIWPRGTSDTVSCIGRRKTLPSLGLVRGIVERKQVYSKLNMERRSFVLPICACISSVECDRKSCSIYLNYNTIWNG